MNKQNPALDCYIDACRDLHTLGQFKPPGMAPWRNFSVHRGEWDMMPSDIGARLIEQKYVIIQKHFVYLTALGKEIIGHEENKI